MDANVREYYLLVLSGTLTMLAGGLVWPVFAPYVRSEFTAPLQLVGYAVSGYFLLRMFTEFPIGVLSGRMGVKAPLVGGRLLALLGAIACYKTNNIWVLILARVIWGIGDASFFCIGMTYVSGLFSAERRGRAMGFFQAVEMIGSLIGQTAAGVVASRMGPRFNFLATASITLLALVTVAMTSGASTHPQTGGRLIPTRGELAMALNRVVLVACLINLFCMMINNGLLGTILPIYATELLGLSLSQYGLLVSASTVGSVAGNLAGGYLSDRVSRRKVLQGALLIGMASIYSLTLFQAFLPLAATMFFKGVFWGSIYGVAPAYIADSVPPQVRGIGIGVFRTFMDMGGLVGPVVMSTLVESVGGSKGYIYSFYLSSALLVGLLASTLALGEEGQG